jgi:hypothetical protein
MSKLEMNMGGPETPQIENQETQPQIAELLDANKKLRQQSYPIYLQLLEGGYFKGEKDGFLISKAFESWKKGALSEVIKDPDNLDSVNDLIQKYADLTRQIKTNDIEIMRLKGEELPKDWERYINEI